MGLQQQRGVARSREGDGEVSRQPQKGLNPVAIVDRIELGLSSRAGGWSLVEGGASEVSATRRDRNPERAHGLLTRPSDTGRNSAGPWKPLEAYAVERILADHQHAVIDLGGGHSVQEDPTLFARLRAALAPVRNLALLLPSPDPEESVRVLTEPRAPPVGFDWHRHFVTHPSNGALAKLVVYTAGQTPGQTSDALYRALFRTAC